MRKAILVLVAIMAISTPAFAAEWLTNGDFETDTPITGTLTDAISAPLMAPTGWTTFNAACSSGDPALGTRGRTGTGVINDGLNTTPGYTMNPINTTKFLYLSARGGNTSGGECGVYQQVDLQPGTYTLTGMITTLNMGLSGADYFGWEVGIIDGAWGNEGVANYGGSGQRIPWAGNSDVGTINRWSIWGGLSNDPNYNSGYADLNNVATDLTGLNYQNYNGTGRSSNQIVVTTAGTYTVYAMAIVKCSPSATNKRRFKLEVDNLSLTGTPDIVPEPGSLLIFGTGLIGIAGAIRRKR